MRLEGIHHITAITENAQSNVDFYAGRIYEALGMPVGSIGPTRGRCLAKLRALLARDPHWEGLL